MEIEDILQIGKRVLSTLKHHEPQALIEISKNGNSSLVCVILAFGTRQEKEEIKQTLKNFIRITQSERYWTIMEAWMSILKKDKMYRLPSRDIDRKEVLIVSEYNKDMKNKSIVLEFRRKNEEIVFGEERQNMNNFESTWNAFVEDEGTNERFDNIQKNHNEQFITTITKKITKKYKKKLNNAMTDEERKKVIQMMINDGKQIINNQNKTILEDIEDSETK